MKLCKNCSAELNDDAKFCSECGEPTEDNLNEKEEIIETTVNNDNSKDQEKDILSGDTSEYKPVDDNLGVMQKEDDLLGEDESNIEDKPIKESDQLGHKEAVGEELGEEHSDMEQLYAEMDEDLSKTQVMQPITEEDEYEYREDDSYERYEEPKKKEKPNYKIPMIIGGAILIAIILFFALNSGGNKGNKDELIEEFITGVSSRDVKTVVQVLDPGKSDLIIDKYGVEAFFKYIDDNPAYVNELENSLELQSKKYDESEIVDGRGDNVVLMTEDGKDYKLVIKPYYMELNVDHKGGLISLSDRKLDETETDNFSKNYGPYMPGIYDLKLEYGDGIEDTNVEIELFDENPLDDKVEMSFDIESGLKNIKITSEHKDAEIYVNGEKINKKIKDLSDGTIDNLTEDSKIQIKVQTPWGEVNSKEVRVGDVSGGVIDFKLNLGETEAGESLKKQVENFLKEDTKAKEDLDASKYKTLEDPELMIRKTRIDKMKDNGYYVESELSNIVYVLDSIDVSKYEDGYHGEINISYDLKETYFWTYAREEQKGKVTMNISLNYDESNNEWKIYNINEDSTLEDIIEPSEETE